jgi:hypothetical protein
MITDGQTPETDQTERFQRSEAEELEYLSFLPAHSSVFIAWRQSDASQTARTRRGARRRTVWSARSLGASGASAPECLRERTPAQSTPARTAAACGPNGTGTGTRRLFCLAECLDYFESAIWPRPNRHNAIKTELLGVTSRNLRPATMNQLRWA